jgi:hypothetical protein
MHLKPADFWQMDYETQLSMICFEMLRQQEEFKQERNGIS